ncbi:TRAP transporter small permease subunit [Hoeflea poritis]|uniref:TRAP transporter small permease protein n=1 Tax=Hoeflea poritis TaxID=2993659 RepID=A0ABT4VUS5_9HYPH|nr:TRAP transporter small permease [Hoeflea poritis]MDA4848444.1 TRAP transporter small permease [Hoeflea poritis]
MSEAPKASWLGRLMAGLSGIGSVLILAMAALICADIVSRSFLGKPIAGVAEMISLSIVAVVFLQVGQTVRAHALARTELLTNGLRNRSPRIEALLQAVYALVGALFFAVLVYGVSFKLRDAWTAGEHAGVYGLFVVPVWPVYAVIVLGSFAAGIQFLIHMVGYLSRAFSQEGARP